MAYTDEGVKAKLSALNETQESIVTVAQWIMFHRYERVCQQALSFVANRLEQETRRQVCCCLAAKTPRFWNS